MADFKWYLNRQGIQGRKGDKGEQGFSPIISEGINDADEYTLLVTNENNTFETPNLRGNFVINDDGVNSTVLYDRESNQLRTGEPVQATTEQLGAMVVASPEDFETINGNGKAVTVDNLVDNFTKIVGSSDGTVIITQDAETSKIDLKAKGTEIDDAVEVKDKTWSSSKIMSTIDNMSNGFNQFIGNIMASISGELDKTNQNVTTNTSNITELQQEVTNTKGDVTALNASVSTLNSTVESHTESITTINNSINELNTNKVSKTELTTELAKKQNNLVAGNNITIVNNEDGTATISSSGSGGATGDVTAAGNNTFTGSNIFVGNSLNVGDGNSYYSVAEFDGQQVHYKYRPDSSSHVVKIGSGSIPISVNSILTTQYNSDEDKYYGVFYLNQDSIVSSDGSVTIDKTPQGIDIKASGGGGDASIDDSNISATTTYSSEKIVNYVTTSIDSAMTTLDNAKQDKLTAGDGISISNGVISATGGGSGGGAMIDDNDTTSLDKTWSCNKLNTELGNVSSALTEIEGGLTATLENYAKLDAESNTFTNRVFFQNGINTSDRIISDNYCNYLHGGKGSINLPLPNEYTTLKMRNPYIGFKPVNKTLEFSDGSAYSAKIGDTLIQGSSITLDCGDLSASTTEVKNGIFDGNGDRILSQGNVTSADNSVSVTKSDKGLDLSANKAVVTGYAFPSNNYVDLTLGASGSTYTAPADGWFTVQINGLSSGDYLIVRNTLTGLRYKTMQSNATAQFLALSLPVSKGNNTIIEYSGAGSDVAFFRFVYANGSVPVS